jgi:hypothetical protein
MNDDQLAKWKAAVAQYHRQQRQRRGKRSESPYGAPRAGMVRVMPPAPRDDGPVDASAAGRLAKCPHRGCPVRWRTGPDRPCADHQPAAELAWDATAGMLTVRGEQDGPDGGRPQPPRPS